jgi:hypothetical protein
MSTTKHDTNGVMQEVDDITADFECHDHDAMKAIVRLLASIARTLAWVAEKNE